jgi:ferredoxin/flavodoxin---NADP+ reductase
MLDLLIIGGGPAGLYASHLAKESGLTYTLVEASFELGGKLRLYQDKPIYDMPAHLDILGKTLIDHFFNQMIANNDNANILLMTYITRIEKGETGFISYTNHHTEIHSQFILITHGGGMFVPRPLGIDNEAAFNNVFYHVEDASKFIQKKLVIFGGGDSATDWAHFFIQNGCDVTLIHRRDDFRGDERLLQDIQTHAKVYTPYKIESVIEDHQRIQAVRISHLKTKEVMTIDCDDVFVFFGTIPIKTHPLHEDLHIDNQRLIVSTSMETSIKGIFASGNGVFYPGKQSMIITALGEVATAMGSIIFDLYPDKIPSYKRT